jgi:hypothetical protein
MSPVAAEARRAGNVAETSRDPRIRFANIALAASGFAGVVGVLKGVTLTLDPGAEFYWRFSYEHGFIKRGLLGTLVHPLLTMFGFEQLKPAIVAAHLTACAVIIVAFERLFASAIRREPRADSRAVLVLAFLCLMSTELLPVLAHDTGGADPWLIVLTLAGFWLVLKARHAAAAMVTIAGPLVHEGFVFLWAPVAILLIGSVISSPTRRALGWKLALASLPVVSALAVTRVHSAPALAQLMDAWPVSDAVKSGQQFYTFGQTLQSSFAHMRQSEFPGRWDNFATTSAFFLIPNLLLIWAAAYCFWRRWSAPLTTLLVATMATVAPLAAVLVAWDLSRFLCWSTVAAGVALVGIGSPTLVSMREPGG